MGQTKHYIFLEHCYIYRGII